MPHTKLVHDFLADSAGRYPEKNAFFSLGQWHTYGRLEEQANRLARLFSESGLKKGERVALLLENSAEYVITYYAILKAGAITVALNTEGTADDIAYIARDCGVRFLVTGPRLYPRVAVMIRNAAPREDRPEVTCLERLFLWSGANPAVESEGSRVVRLPEGLSGAPNTAAPVRGIDLDVASIVYTSGSTGKPRGATLSHLNIVSNTRSIVDYLELTSDDRIMVVLPFFYIYGKSLLNTHFYVGGSVVVDNRFLYPNVVLQTMREQAATGFAGVPSTFTILLSRSNLKSSTFPKLRYVTQAGGAMAPAVQKEVVTAFDPAKLFVMYGATEASARLSYLHPKELPRKWGSIGIPIPNVNLFVADDMGNPLGPGREGEIVAHGSNIMSGYWNHPEETQKVLRNGLYYTGDIGMTDEEGFLYVVGRTKDMIKVGGNRVSAKEIEEVLYEHPAVIEAAVISVPDEVLGEAPKAFIVLKGGFTGDIKAQLIEFMKGRLALYKIPKSVELRDSLPKNEAGKIHKLSLR